ncbi:MAG: hypothetical protein LC798_17700 [Chloroflexi bacterium]|nr:hypothetical protein [Chloroflexota bacterium]
MSTPRPRLEIRVDEVVVRGLPPAQARSAVAALEARLRALGEGWVASGTPILPREEAFRRTPITTPRTASPVAVGESTASAVWATIAGGERR